MRGEAVPQGVRADALDACSARVRLEDEPESLARQALTMVIEIHGALHAPADQSGPSIVEVLDERTTRFPSKGDLAFLGTLTGAANVVGGHVYVFEIEGDQLAYAHPR